MLLRITGCVVVAVLVAGSAWVAFAQPTDSQDKQDGLLKKFMAEETQVMDAIEAHDRPALAKLLSDQVMAVTVARGRKTTADHLDAIASLPLKDFEITEVKTIPVTRDVAIFNFKLSWTDSGAETPAKTVVYATVVWKQIDGQWRSIFYQETPIAK